MSGNHSFRAHVHLERKRSFSNLRAQEPLAVLKWQVEFDYFTDSGDWITTEVLGSGDISISFRGGHGYRILTSDAFVYAFKSGPYERVRVEKEVHIA